MKKILIPVVIIIVLLIVGLMSCSGDSTETKTVDDSTISADADSTSTDAELSEDDLSIEELTCVNADGEWTEYVLLITNNSDKTINLDAQATALDENGSSLEVCDDFNYCIPSGDTQPLLFYFDTVDAVSFDYDISVSESSSESLIDSMYFDVTENEDNVIIEATNNSDEDIEFPYARILFFDEDGNLVKYDSGYFNDGDVLKAGDSYKCEFSYSGYGSYQVYYTAH